MSFCPTILFGKGVSPLHLLLHLSWPHVFGTVPCQLFSRARSDRLTDRQQRGFIRIPPRTPLSPTHATHDASLWKSRAFGRLPSQIFLYQGSAKRLLPGCVNATGMVRQKRQATAGTKTHQTWGLPFSPVQEELEKYVRW